MAIQSNQQPSLFSAITIGVGSIVGSGWLFASYFASQFAGPAALFSWGIGAVIALILALLLGEIATVHSENSLFSRLLTITHNRDIGFIVAVSNWLAMIAIIPSEAVATVDYLGGIYPPIKALVFNHNDLTFYGVLCVWGMLIIYGMLNYWGIKTLSKANNLITTVKLIVPLLTGIVIILTMFHPANFTVYHNTIMPYGVQSIFTAVVSCGIFYAFYGFSMITIFAKELKNPKRNIPLALGGSVLICLLIYMVLQIAFIGAMDTTNIGINGWHSIQFHSPLANLAAMLGINWLVVVLYIDSALSPSGTAIIYTGSGTRMLQAMAEDNQMPKFFACVNPEFFISRTSLVFSLAICFLLATCASWQKIVVIVTVFQLISCLAIPIAFTKLRKPQPNALRLFKMPCGNLVSICAYLIVTYLLTQCGGGALLLSWGMHIIFVIIYCGAYYRFNMGLSWKVLKSSWSLLLYMPFIALCGFLQDYHMLNKISVLVPFFVISLLFYVLLVQQKTADSHCNLRHF